MRVGKEIVGKPIYTADEGRWIGKVQDLYVDAGLEQVTGLFVGSQGLLKRKSQFISRDDVVVLGVDAILVRDGSVIQDDQESSSAAGWLRRDKLENREVDTAGGTRLAAIGDIIVDDDGRITGFKLSRVFLEGPLKDVAEIDRSFVIDAGEGDGRINIDLTSWEAALTGADAPAAADGKADEEIAIVVSEPAPVTVTGDEASETVPDSAEAETED